MAEPVKVLYIAGAGRTGSTLIEKLLGQIDGVFAAGELTFMWEYAVRGRCSCGRPLVECPTWKAVFDAAYGGIDHVDIEEMVAARARYSSNHLPLMVTAGIRRRLFSRLDRYPGIVERLYVALRDTTSSRVIVDSSKEPHYSYILRSLPALDVRVLHLVRDPRAVAYSWSRRREQKGIPGSMMDVRSPATSSAYYAVSNVATELLWARRAGRYLRVRYEDFLNDPLHWSERFSELMDEDLRLGGVLADGRTADLKPTHSAWGNPHRFDRGSVSLREDDEWIAKMATSARRTVTVLTSPLLRHYRYPGRPRPPVAARTPRAGLDES